ncbi:hypothetical protein M8J75_012931 [Diaphorina citri]|nr:hypothetical protein M8J75_012931 [Diaphorina citri]
MKLVLWLCSRVLLVTIILCSGMMHGQATYQNHAPLKDKLYDRKRKKNKHRKIWDRKKYAFEGLLLPKYKRVRLKKLSYQIDRTESQLGKIWHNQIDQIKHQREKIWHIQINQTIKRQWEKIWHNQSNKSKHQQEKIWHKQIEKTKSQLGKIWHNQTKCQLGKIWYNQIDQIKREEDIWHNKIDQTESQFGKIWHNQIDQIKHQRQKIWHNQIAQIKRQRKKIWHNQNKRGEKIWHNQIDRPKRQITATRSSLCNFVFCNLLRINTRRPGSQTYPNLPGSTDYHSTQTIGETGYHPTQTIGSTGYHPTQNGSPNYRPLQQSGNFWRFLMYPMRFNPFSPSWSNPPPVNPFWFLPFHRPGQGGQGAPQFGYNGNRPFGFYGNGPPQGGTNGQGVSRPSEPHGMVLSNGAPSNSMGRPNNMNNMQRPNMNNNMPPNNMNNNPNNNMASTITTTDRSYQTTYTTDTNMLRPMTTVMPNSQPNMNKIPNSQSNMNMPNAQSNVSRQSTTMKPPPETTTKCNKTDAKGGNPNSQGFQNSQGNQNSSFDISEDKNLTAIWINKEQTKLKNLANKANNNRTVQPNGNGQVGLTGHFGISGDKLGINSGNTGFGTGNVGNNGGNTGISGGSSGFGAGNVGNNGANTGISGGNVGIQQDWWSGPSHASEFGQGLFVNNSRYHDNQFVNNSHLHDNQSLFYLPSQFNFTTHPVPLWWNITAYEPGFGEGLFVNRQLVGLKLARRNFYMG